MKNGKVIRRTFLITLAVIFVFAAATYVFVHTSLFAGYARGKVVQLAEAKSGMRVNIKSLSIPWDQLVATVRGIAITGRESPSQPPLFRAQEVKVGVAIGPLLSGHFKLSHVVLDHPVVHIAVNSQGRTNFPTPATTKQASNSNSSSPVNSLFSLGIRHLEIDQGEFYYNDAKMPLSADLTDFDANVFFNARSNEYYGSLGYANGRISTNNYGPVENSAHLQFTASRSRMDIDPLTITLPRSKFTLHATLRDYSDPDISGTYATELSTTEVSQVLRDSTLPAGTISANGKVAYHRVPERSFLETVQLTGTLSSPYLDLHLRNFSTPINATRARFALTDGELRISSMRGDVLGGQLNVSSGEISLSGKSASQLSATLTNLALPELSKALPSQTSERLSFVGRADVNARLSWLSHFRDLVINSRATISSPPPHELTSGQIPLNGTVQMAYSRALNKASFGHSRINIGKTSISMNGVLSDHSDLMVTLTSDDLHQFSALADKVEQVANSGTSGKFRISNINGSGRFDGRVYGSPRNPQIKGQLTAQDLEVESTQWSMIHANLGLSPSHASIGNGLFISKSLGRIQLTASVGLRQWSVTPSSPISAHVAATNLPVSKIETLAHVSYPVDGIASADITIAGTKQNPSVHGWIHFANATAWKQPVKLVSVNFHGDSRSLEADIAAKSPAGPIAGELVYDSLSKHYQLHMNTSGLKLGELEMVQARHLPLRGTLVLNGSGNGSIGNPEFSASLEIRQLAFHGETVSNIRSQINLENRQMKFAANGTLYQGSLQAQGSVALTGQYQATASLDARSVSVGLVTARYLRRGGPAPDGKADLHVVAQGPLKDPSQFTIRAEIPAMSLSYQTVTLAMVRPLIAEYHSGVIELQKSEIKGTGIDLSFQGSVPLNSSKPLGIAADGAVNLSLLQSMTNTFQSSGQVKVNITARGTLTQPNMQGSLQLQNASLTSASMPVDLTAVTGDIRVSGRRMEIVKLNGNVNGGSMTAQGTVDLGKTPAFDLAVAAQSVTVNYPAGVRARLNGDLRLNGATTHSALTGRVLIDYLGFTQQMDIASLANQFSSGGGVSTPSNFEKNMKLNIALQSSSSLALASSELSVQGAANLDVVGTLADPVVLGRATLTNGELFFLGKRYEIKSGTIEFVNPTQTMATVDLYAATTVNQYNISLHFAGPVDQMKTSFTSTPALPQADIINLLAFGRTTEQASTSPTPGGLGAESLLAQGVASQVSGHIQKLAGISQLSITPFIANGQQNPGAQVSIQQRVSGRLLVTFMTNTAETQSTAVQVQYQLGHGLSVSALRDQNGGYGVDVHLHKSF